MNNKKIFLIIIVSLAFVFGMFSRALAITTAEARANYIAAINAATVIKNAAIADANAAYDAVFATQNPFLSNPATHDTALAVIDAAAVVRANAINTANIAYINAKNAADLALAKNAATIKSEPLQPGCTITNGQEVCSLENPIGAGQKGTTEATQIIATIIKTFLGIIGALTLLMLVWGGFQWLTSAGNPEKVKMGTQTMVWAIIGVLLVFASYMLLSTFTGYLTGKTGASSGGVAISGVAGCECDLKVSGTGCSIDQRETFSFGQVVTVGSMLDKVSWSSCPAKSFIPDSYKNQSLTVTEDGCSTVSQSGNNSGYDFSVQCRVVR